MTYLFKKRILVLENFVSLWVASSLHETPVGYPWEGWLSNHVGHKSFRLSLCLRTVACGWRGRGVDRKCLVQGSSHREALVPEWRLLNAQVFEADSSEHFPKTEWTLFSFLVVFGAGAFRVLFSSLSFFRWVPVEDRVCLLDCIVVDLQDMDIFAAERRPREYSKASDDSSGDLVFPSYFVRQTGGSLLTEPCQLKLQVERNLDKWVVYIWIIICCRYNLNNLEISAVKVSLEENRCSLISSM